MSQVVPPKGLADCLADGQSSGAADVLQRLLFRNGYPISVSLGITEYCNLRCPHCFVPRPEQEHPLDLAELGVLLDELASLGVLNVTITGGEPSLRRDFIQIIGAARVRRFNVTLKTNGMKLSRKVLDELHEAGLHRIDTSIYHDLADAHDEFVGMRGAFQAMVESLDYWVTLGGTAVVSFIAMAWNIERVQAVVTLARTHGFNHRISPIVTCRSDGDPGPLQHRLGPEGLVRLLEEDGLVDAEAYTSPMARGDDRTICMGGINNPHIAPGGQVFICQSYAEVMGSVREQTFREIWDSSPVRRKFTEARWRDLPVCSTCEISWACNRCPASAWLEGGDFFGPSGADCALAEAKSIVVGHPGKRPAK